jgi:hypothetical protein
MWYGWARHQLEQEGISTALQSMPDPSRTFLRPSQMTVVASESIWLPFTQDTLRCDENTIVIGHSSGAEAAMRSALVVGLFLTQRYAETHTILGLVLVAPCVTDQGIDLERQSGEFNLLKINSLFVFCSFQ